MTTGTAPVSPPSRRDPRQVINTLRKTITLGDTGITTGIAFDNSLPLGANITDVQVEVVTAWNAGTTNVITVGTNSSSYNDIVASGDVTPGSTGVTKVSRGWGQSICVSAEKTPYAIYTQTGGSATTGKAIITISYEGGWAS